MATSDTGTRAPLQFRVVLFCLALLGAAGMAYYHLGLFLPRVVEVRASKGLGNGYSFGDDFYPIWLVARQSRLDHGDPYRPEMTRQIQTGLFGRPLDARNPADPPVDYREFAYPAFTELLLWPTAALDFPKLRLVLAMVLPCLTVVSLWWWLRALDWRLNSVWFAVLAMLTLSNYEVLEALFAEQPGLIVGFLIAGTALALRRNQMLLAGVLLSLTLIKPQMTLLAAMYLLLWSLSDRQRTRFWIGFSAALLLLMGSSLVIWPYWVGRWLKVLLGYHRYATPPLVTVLLGPNLGAYFGPVAIMVLVGVSAGLAWRNRRAGPESPAFWLTLSLLLAITSVAVLPGQAIYDHVILLPGIFLVVRNRRALWSAGRVCQILLAIGALIVVWPWLAASALIMARHWIDSGHFYSDAIFALPIRTAASLPFAVLALLACASRVNLDGTRESA